MSQEDTFIAENTNEAQSRNNKKRFGAKYFFLLVDPGGHVVDSRDDLQQQKCGEK